MRIGAQTSLCHFDFGTYCYTNVTMSLLFRYALLHKRHYVILILVCIATQNITMSLISVRIATQTSLCHSEFGTYCYTNVTNQSDIVMFVHQYAWKSK
jgi:ACR3 family arsenite efflux pump ArsB